MSARPCCAANAKQKRWRRIQSAEFTIKFRGNVLRLIRIETGCLHIVQELALRDTREVRRAHQFSFARRDAARRSVSFWRAMTDGGWQRKG